MGELKVVLSLSSARGDPSATSQALGSRSDGSVLTLGSVDLRAPRAWEGAGTICCVTVSIDDRCGADEDDGLLQFDQEFGRQGARREVNRRLPPR